MDVSSISSLTGANTGPSGVPDSQKVRNAAQDFESLLLTQMLKTMREASGNQGWLGTGDDQSSSSIMELAEQQVAQALAASGGLGLARLAADGLRGADPPANSSR